MPPIDVVSPPITIVIRGRKGAFWCDPRTKGDPLSYAIPTPPAAEGVIRGAYYKPSIQYEIRRIGMLTSPAWESCVITTPWHRPGTDKFNTGAMLQTHTALVGDVAWAVTFAVVEHRPTGEPDPGHPDGYLPEVCRKLADDQRWANQLYLGRAAFPGWIEPADERVYERVVDYDMDFGALTLMDLPPAPRLGAPSPPPIFFRAIMRHGILDLPEDLYETSGARALIRAYNNSAPGLGKTLDERPWARNAAAKRRAGGAS